MTATARRKAKTSSQSSAMFSEESCFALPGFALDSAASIVTTLSSSLASYALLEESASDAHSVMERSKILRSLPASDLLRRIAASNKNG